MKKTILLALMCLALTGYVYSQSQPRIVGVPSGGTTGQALIKNSNTNFDVGWGAGGGGGAPTDATYITQTADGSLSAEQALASLSTGIMRVATTTGVVTSLTDSAGIAANISDETGSGSLVFGTSPTLVTPVLGTPTSGTLTNCTGGGGYVMEGGAFSTQTLLDATTYFYGYSESLAATSHTTIANAQMIVPKAGTITRVHWSTIIGTNGSNEAVTHIIRKNNTTDTTLSSSETYDPGANTAKAFTYTGLSIAVAVGDTIVLKVITPTWATNPTYASAHLMIWIE